MAKRLSENQKQEIIKNFINGKNVLQLAVEYGCTKLTISRNIQKVIGEKEFKKLTKENNTNVKDNSEGQKEKNNSIKKFNKSDFGNLEQNLLDKQNVHKEDFVSQSFVEITPLNFDIDNQPQKEVSSKPIDSINLPNIVYLIIDKKIELNIKLLKEYPEWQFLPQEDLNRKTIQIYSDLKIAKKICSSDQKVIKIPNSNIFKLVAPFLIQRGISRIISNEELIAL